MIETDQLLDQYLDICNSDRNKFNNNLFRETNTIITDKFRGVPKNLEDTGNKVPFIFWFGSDILREFFDINLINLYTDPSYFLKKWLEIKIFHFNNFEDNNCFNKFIPQYLGEGFEATLFGCKLKYSYNNEPCIDPSYIILKNSEDLAKMKMPSFKNNPRMYFAKKWFEEVRSIVNKKGIEVGFIDWHYGPTAIANYLRGLSNLSIDFLTNKDFVNKLMEFITYSRINWSKGRDNYLGKKRNMGGMIYNDSVVVPNISPEIYRESIFPYENILYKFYGNFSYYHNCGPIDPFIGFIKKFKNIDLIHSGPFSDYKLIGKQFAKHSPIELHLKPNDDFIASSELDFKNKLFKIKDAYNTLGIKSYCVRLTVYKHPGMEINDIISKLRKWCHIAKEVLN